ncbi:putative ferrichrome ABC transporter substrate-binding protein [Actinacidiphila reveromycinica]|uniref:Putative ferrichrome ABC transporter substrate-binding protein n=1 Tax=Actinacidiphila reveromycinica TaxID=659352 RepID=A0A7U3VT24_9ACTN|nr:ABC transporter substrate-binding protein [Streptomyces sp. SN-593]BBB02290.1 putative ferrichrome ABC transporter substrate-binding protein [Streptomyces sp. SN-593]
MSNFPRIRLLPLVAAALIAALAACSSSTSSSTSDAAASHQRWTFTDDLGKTVTLDHAPTRVAGMNDEIVPLMHYGLKPVASWGYSTIKDDARFDGLDTSGVQQVGSVAGEIDVEKLAAARPDIIVSEVYPTDEKGTIDTTQPDYGFKDLAQQKQVEAIAPVVTILIGGDGADVVEHTTKLALALGADSATVAKAKATYTAASDRLRKAAAANPVTVAALYADSDGINAAKYQDDPALRLYSDLGVKFFAPEPKGFYWADYSWENAGQVGGDVWLLEQDGYDRAQLAKQPTVAKSPALAAGQVHPWLSATLDYVSQAQYMDQLSGWIGAAKAVTG